MQESFNIFMDRVTQIIIMEGSYSYHSSICVSSGTGIRNTTERI